MLEEDTGSGVKSWAEGLRCEQEVLRTDTGSGDRGLCVWLEPPWWYRRVGWERSQAQEETAGLGSTQCVLYAALG